MLLGPGPMPLLVHPRVPLALRRVFGKVIKPCWEKCTQANKEGPMIEKCMDEKCLPEAREADRSVGGDAWVVQMSSSASFE